MIRNKTNGNHENLFDPLFCKDFRSGDADLESARSGYRRGGLQADALRRVEKSQHVTLVGRRFRQLIEFRIRRRQLHAVAAQRRQVLEHVLETLHRVARRRASRRILLLCRLRSR